MKEEKIISFSSSKNGESKSNYIFSIKEHDGKFVVTGVCDGEALDPRTFKTSKEADVYINKYRKVK